MILQPLSLEAGLLDSWITGNEVPRRKRVGMLPDKFRNNTTTDYDNLMFTAVIYTFIFTYSITISLIMINDNFMFLALSYWI